MLFLRTTVHEEHDTVLLSTSLSEEESEEVCPWWL